MSTERLQVSSHVPNAKTRAADGRGEACRYSGHPGKLARLLQRELTEDEEATRERFTAVAKRLMADDYLRDTRREARTATSRSGWKARSNVEATR